MSKPDLKQFIGIPFMDSGRGMDGADCWGLAKLVFAAYGIEVPDFRIGALKSNLISEQVRLEKESGRWERLREPVAPCLVLMSIDRAFPRAINHLGVYVGGGKMLHTCVPTNSHMDSIDHPYWKQKIRGFYRWKE